MITVSNTTPIISLSAIGKIKILRDIFQKVIISEVVYNEIKAKPGYGYDDVDSSFISVETVRSEWWDNIPLVSQLDQGELETIGLSQKLQADNTIIDENMGYTIAKASGLNVIRTLSILLKAKEQGIISEVKPLLDDLVLKGRWYSKRVYLDFLLRAGEIGR